MKKYLVGGAVRDILLGTEPKDRDYVVVGATPEEMIKNGFTQVGKSFPVFLHPKTSEEYALARKERKTGPGYNGFEVDFDPSVTLEEDLSRRDLTMNSIAYDEETKKFIDPFGGMKDIEDKTIRHVGDAFSEDPLRVMRVARFVARYNFKIAPETFNLCEKVMQSEDFDRLSTERIWVEFEKIVSEPYAEKGLQCLIDFGGNSSKKLSQLLLTDHQLYENICKICGQMSVLIKELTLTEKMLMLTQIGVMSKETANNLKIPSDVKRNVDFLKDMWNASTDKRYLVDVFDKYRQEIKDGKSTEFLKFATKFSTTFLIRFSRKAEGIFSELTKLNFTEEVKGMKGSEIKEFVRQKKLDVVRKHV